MADMKNVNISTEFQDHRKKILTAQIPLKFILQCDNPNTEQLSYASTIP